MSPAWERTGVLVQVNSLQLGGTQINAVDLAATVRELGYDSVLIGPRDSMPEGPSLFDVAADREVRLETFERPTTTAGGARDLARIAARHGVGLVHTYGTWGCRPAYWGPCLLARRALVMTVYEMEVDPVVYRAPSLIVGTGYLVDDLADRHGPVHLISPPVDLARDDPAAVSTDEFLSTHALDPAHLRIVVVSRLDDETLRPVKCTGIEQAMLAVEQLAAVGHDADAEVDVDVDIVVVGTGNDESRLREVGDEVNARLGRRACVFTGPLSDPRPAYAAADVVLGMGGSAARGLAFAKPLVVVGEYGWYRTFRPDTSASLFRSSFWSEEQREDPVGDLVGELRPLLRDPARRDELGRFGRAFAETNYGLTAMAGRLATVYDEARSGYRVADWMYDQRLEGAWAGDWVARRWDDVRRRAGRAPHPSAGSGPGSGPEPGSATKPAGEVRVP